MNNRIENIDVKPAARKRLNGTAHPRMDAKPAPSKAAPSKAARPTKADRDATARKATLRRNVALAIAIVDIIILGLSVVHCTESIGLLTGSAWYLAAPLAVGIDAGMVLTELAELIGSGAALKRWARSYIGLSVLMSMGLNAYAFGQHATIPVAGGALGILLPALVLILGRVAGHLAHED